MPQTQPENHHTPIAELPLIGSQVIPPTRITYIKSTNRTMRPSFKHPISMRENHHYRNTTRKERACPAHTGGRKPRSYEQRRFENTCHVILQMQYERTMPFDHHSRHRFADRKCWSVSVVTMWADVDGSDLIRWELPQPRVCGQQARSRSPPRHLLLVRPRRHI